MLSDASKMKMWLIRKTMSTPFEICRSSTLSWSLRICSMPTVEFKTVKSKSKEIIIKKQKNNWNYS